jgi:hypothetical protein
MRLCCAFEYQSYLILDGSSDGVQVSFPPHKRAHISTEFEVAACWQTVETRSLFRDSKDPSMVLLLPSLLLLPKGY